MGRLRLVSRAKPADHSDLRCARMTSTAELTPVSGPAAWRGDELSKTGEWIYHLSDAERQELEEAGRKFVADDPDLRTVTAADYPLPACAGLNAESAQPRSPRPE